MSEQTELTTGEEQNLSFPQPREVGERIELDDAYIYEPETLDLLHRRFGGKRVLVVDANGVICDNPPEGARLRFNPKAKKALRTLRARGYELVLWTTAKKGMEEPLRRGGFLDLFNLAIFREHFAHDPLYSLSIANQDIRQRVESFFRKAVESASWLTQEEKDDVLSERQSLVKTPEVLFREAGVIDDNLYRLPDETRYPFFVTNEFGGKPKYRRLMKDVPDFSDELLPDILQRFPPPKV